MNKKRNGVAACIVLTLLQLQIKAACTSCTSCGICKPKAFNQRFAERMNALHNLKAERKQELKKRLAGLHALKHPTQQTAVTTLMPEAIAEDQLTGEERTHLKRISQMLTPILVAYNEETIAPSINPCSSEKDLDCLNTTNMFLVKLNAAYEKLPKPTQEFFKSTSFSNQPIGSVVRTLMKTLKKYVTVKQSAYKGVKSQDALTKEIKKLTNVLEKMLNSWQEIVPF